MSEEDSCADGGSSLSKNIRRATIDDIDAIIGICRTAFPNYLIWCTKRCARRWWDCILRSKSNETWVYQFDTETVALIRLIVDEHSYKKEIRKLKPRIGAMLCVFIVRPQLLFEKILETITRVTSSSVRYSDSNDLGSLAKRSVWVHTRSVLPRMRNKGIGTSMMQFCEQRAIELGYDSIKLFVKTSNKGSIRHHERLGFVRTGKIKDHYSYVKLLSNNNDKKVFLKAQ